MLYRETFAVCSQMYTQYINALCGQNVELLNVKLAVHLKWTNKPLANIGGSLSCKTIIWFRALTAVPVM
jgi:hypothetical protein